MSTWLHDIVFLDPRSRWRVYRVVMAIGFLYGIFNDQVLGRATRTVVPEMAAIMAIATLVSLTLLAHRKRALGGERPVKLGVYLLTLTVIVSLTVVINVGGAARLEQSLFDRKITSIISGENVDIARLSVLLRSASALKLHSDEAVRTQMASRIWQIERQSPGQQTWEAVTALANYDSSIASGDSVIKRVKSQASAFGIEQPRGLLVWKNTNTGDIVLDGLIGGPELTQPLGSKTGSRSVPGSIAALIVPIGSPPIAHPAAEGPAYYIVGARPAGNIASESAHISVPMDGSYCRNVIFKRCRIIYRGGPLVLDNVAFEDCIFDVPNDERGRTLIGKVVGSEPIGFNAGNRLDSSHASAGPDPHEFVLAVLDQPGSKNQRQLKPVIH